MEVINYLEGNVKGKSEKVEIFSLEEGLRLNFGNIFFVPMRMDEGYLFFRRTNGKPGCYFMQGTKTSPQRDSVVEILFKDLLIESLAKLS